ncbi:MAG: molecular chaperone HtpG [Gammaproteobacteria bacterium]
MTTEAQKETLEFQAEVSQVLNLVIRSLYSNKEIFLRELISNASDAAEKLRFEAISDDGLYEEDPNLKIRIHTDEEAGTITIEDNGIGMSRQEVSETIGTIASSGTKKFLEKMTGDQTQDSQLIGQFGVGFYSAFIVADKVTLITRRAGLGAEHGVKWVSSGEGSYSIENVDSPERGTRITLHLREDEKEFLQPYRIRSIISKFSDHIAIPVEMLEEVPPLTDEEKEKGEEEKTPEWEKVNKGTALWMRSKSDITDEEYNEFYKSVGHDFEDPLLHVHNRVEGKNEYSSLLYIPSRAPFDMWDREQKHGVKLYVKRVFIMDEADKLMPHYLRFVKGVVDSDDLPLNVSREILQHDKKIDSIRSANVKRILDALEKLAKKDEEKYQGFWKEFGRVMKEGPAEDFANKEKIAGLLRFATTKSEGDAETVSLDQYIENMVEKQELVSHLTDFKGKHLQSIAKGQLDLGELEDKEEKEQQEKIAEEHKSLIERLTASLGDDVKEVRVSSRLTESPACLVVGDYDMSQNMARVLKQIGQDAPMPTPILEINVEHPLLDRMDNESDEDRFKDMAKLVFDQALLAEGGQLEDPASFVHNMNKLMLDMAK